MKQKPRGKGSLHLSRATTKARPAVHADHLEGGPRLLWDEPKIFFLERRYFFSIILSEFLKNRVALHQHFGNLLQYVFCNFAFPLKLFCRFTLVKPNIHIRYSNF